MFAVEVQFLTGRYVATAHDDREKSEWPPHPARFFSALVAEWGSADVPDDGEAELLRYLETLPPPSICASDAAERSVVTHYVPVNDASITGAALWRRSEQVDAALADLADDSLPQRSRSAAERKLAKARDVDALVAATVRQGASTLPQHRTRQARTFPSVTPATPLVAFVWDGSDLSDGQRRTLDGLLERVTRLGHSSSLVSCRLAEVAPEITHIPSSRGDTWLRGVSHGQFDALVSEFAAHRGSRPRSLPSAVVMYSTSHQNLATAPRQPSTGGDWFVVEFDKRRLSAHRLVAATTALRGAVLAHCPEPPEILHGHSANGRPTDRPHVSFLGLPDVGHPHAHGQLIGAAVMLPADCGRSDRQAVLAAIGRWSATSRPIGLKDGRLVRAELVEAPSLRSLQRETWAGISREWVSATPLALPWRARKSGERANEWELAAEWVADSCEHVGLARPDCVEVSLAPLLQGALPANRYPAFRQSTIARRLVHARIRFAESVIGPIVLGSGRFLGLGLLRPVSGEAS